MFPPPPRGVLALFCKPTDLSPDSWGKNQFCQSRTTFFLFGIKIKKNSGKKFLIFLEFFLFFNKANFMTQEKFIEKAKAFYGDRYDYSKVVYHKTHEKVCIICPIHGEFWQTPHNHLSSLRNGCGCPKCANMVSKLEESVINRLNEENISFKKEYVNKKIFGNMRGDFFIKSYNAMIECQGSQHFEENNPLQRSYGGNLSGQIERDYNFNKCCKDANIKLFYYFDEDNTKGVDYLNDKKFNGIYTEKNTFTNIDSLISCIKNA